MARPKVAILAAVETVTSKMPATIDAASLCKMAERGQIKGGLLDGPLAFDNAISKDAARVKGIASEVAGDPDILLAPDLEAGNILAKQLTFLANADSAGLVLGARVPIILTSRADSVRSRIASCAVAMLAAHARRNWRAGEVMDDYALVLNAGSSSLKFCVYRRPEAASWSLEARGQIEGIGTSPRFTAKDGAGTTLAAETLDATVRDVPAALDGLAAWLRGRYGGARVLGVGHRVVHGGAKYASPVVVTPDVIADLTTLVPLAPLHQPYNLAAIEAVAKQLPGVPQVACFDTSFHRGQPAVAEIVPLPAEIRHRGVQRYGFHGLSYEYIASVLPEVAPEIADGRVIVAHLGSGASLCALASGAAASTAPWASPRSTGSAWARVPGSVDPGRHPLPVPDAGPLRQGSRDDALQEVGTARHLGDQQRHARPDRERGAERGTGRRLLRLPRGQGNRCPRRGPRRPRRAGVHSRHRRELGRHSRADLPGLRLAGHRSRPGCERAKGDRESPVRRAACPPGSSPPTKN